MLIVVNPQAGEGRGLARWREIEPKVRERVGPFRTVVTEDPESVPAVVAQRLAAGETAFVAAGGDGTVNLLMRSLVEHINSTDLREIRLGAIGLGSSNDFHKPIQTCGRIDGVPCRLDFASAKLHDVCLVTFQDEEGARRRRPWLINSSIGTTAEANHFFNHPNRPLRLLKRFAPGLAIAYAALRTLARRRSQDLTVTIDDSTELRIRVANLGVVKNPHLTGSLRYDSPIEPASGRFYVHLLADVSLARLLLALGRLARGRFSGQRGARSWRAVRVGVRSERPFALEGDGEVVLAREASFCVMPRLLRIAA
jgi:diacylglycerol kinase family enzyme